MRTATEGILSEVRDERQRQDEKWGIQGHSPEYWMMILMEEVGEAAMAALEAPYKDKVTGLIDERNELIQVAAVAVARIEHIDKQVNHVSYSD